MLLFLAGAIILLLIYIIIQLLERDRKDHTIEYAHEKFEMLANMLNISAFNNRAEIKWSDRKSFELVDSLNPFEISIINFKYEGETLTVTWKSGMLGTNPVMFKREYRNLTHTGWQKQENIAKDLVNNMQKML